MEYHYEYSSMGMDGDLGAVLGMGLGAFLLVTIVVCTVLSAVSIVATWRIYRKAGCPGWACLVPFYNLYILYEISLGNGWLFLTMLVPFVNFVFLVKVMIGLSRKFGYPGVFALGLIFLPIVFYCILAFSSAEYEGTVRRAEVPRNEPEPEMDRAAAIERMRRQREQREGR